MILLDTNVLIEPLRREAEPNVIEWIDAQAVETLYLSAISLSELWAGIARLPVSQRRSGLEDSLERRILPLFSGRVLPFDLPCSRTYVEVLSKAHMAGLTIGTATGFIAATAAANGLAVATRDIKHFEAAGLEVINPWGEVV